MFPSHFQVICVLNSTSQTPGPSQNITLALLQSKIFKRNFSWLFAPKRKYQNLLKEKLDRDSIVWKIFMPQNILSSSSFYADGVRCFALMFVRHQLRKHFNIFLHWWYTLLALLFVGHQLREYYWSPPGRMPAPLYLVSARVARPRGAQMILVQCKTFTQNWKCSFPKVSALVHGM